MEKKSNHPRPTAADAAVTEAALRSGWSHRHRDVSSGWLRPTVFGAVDGLVTNAARMSAAVSKDPEVALRFHTREELGMDAADLPLPLLAGGASLVAFSIGAILPLLPYLIGRPSLLAAMGITAVALLILGTVVGRLTGRPLLWSGVRQLLLPQWRWPSPFSWASS